jgi:hypothetical protein
MRVTALTIVLVATTAGAQESALLPPGQAEFAREMIACGQQYVALKLLEPGGSTPTEIAAEGHAYLDAAVAAAGDDFVERETPAIRQRALAEISSIPTQGSRATTKAITKLKKSCDAKLEAKPIPTAS